MLSLPFQLEYIGILGHKMSERFRLEGAGKGDKERPKNKIKFDDNWIRAFGKKCENCFGTGAYPNTDDPLDHVCRACKGIGKVG